MKFVTIDIKLKDGRIVQIREAEKRDAEALIVVAKSNLQTSEYLSLYEYEFDSTPDEEIAWIESHDKPNSLLLVATHENGIIATFNASGLQNIKMKHIAVLGMSILRERRGLGLGNILFEHLISWAKNNQHLEILTLEVFSENKVAIKLCEKFGFVKEGERKNYFKDRKGKYFDNIIMSLYLERV